jgi:CBS domain containing-hemolysin-like protein
VLLTVLNERFELALPVDRADTVSGYVWQHLGRLPAVGDTAPLVATEKHAESDSGNDASPLGPDSSMRVDSVDGTLVERVSFTLPADEPGEYP